MLHQDIAKSFKNFLISNKTSKNTLKNYLSDFNHFWGWLILHLKSLGFFIGEDFDLGLFKKINSQTIEEYKKYLLANKVPNSTINRRLSTVRKFSSFCLNQRWIEKDFTQNVANIPRKFKPEYASDKERYLAEFSEQLTKEKTSSITIKNYLNDIKNFFYWLERVTPPEKPLLKRIDAFVIAEYQDRLLKIASLSPRSVNRKISSLRKFCSFVVQKGYLATNPFSRQEVLPSKKLPFLGKIFKKAPPKIGISKEIFAPAKISQKGWPWYKKLFFHLRYTRPKWYQSYNQHPLANYFHWAILIIFCTGLGFGIYQQFTKIPEIKPKLAVAPTGPPLFLSFQGRLTDESDNPITSPTWFTFAIYNDESASGSARLWYETKSITPDQDGIFNTLLGDTNPIDKTIFKDNTALWLGVTIETNPEMTPRQPIATVAYAFNAEYLRGYAVASLTSEDETATAGAEINTIPVINAYGNLVIAAPSPSIYSTSGNFTLKGQVLTIQSTTGYEGGLNISEGNTLEIKSASGSATLRLDQLGTGDLFTASASGETKAILSSTGTLTLAGGITAATSGTINGISISSGTISSATWNGSAIGTQYGGTGQNFSSTSKGSLLYFSDTGTIGTLTGAGTDNYVLKYDIDTSTPFWGPESGGGGENYWTITSGAIYPVNSTLDLLIGGTASSSAKFAVLNINSGTPTASIAGQLTLHNSGTNYINSLGGQALSLRTSPGGDIGLTDRLYISNSGYVGIGTTNPYQKLHLYDSTNDIYFRIETDKVDGFAGILMLNDARQWNIGVDSGDDFFIRDQTGLATIFEIQDGAPGGTFFINSSGNVGIGTTSPFSLLSVGSSSQFQVDSSGDMVKIKNLTYSWPTSHTTNGVLTNDGSGGLSWSTIGSSGITPDSLDFTEFQDTLDLDANLTLNQSTYTWTQNFDGTTTTGLTYNANSLTSGTGLYISSTATGLTGDLVKIEASGNNAGVTGNVLKVGLTGASATGTALNITTAGSSGFALRVNDDGTYTDSTPFVIDASGNVGIGTTDPGTYNLYVSGTANVSTSLTTPLIIGSSSLSLRPASNSTTAIQLQNAGGTPILNIDTTNQRVGIGTTSPLSLLNINSAQPGFTITENDQPSGYKNWEITAAGAALAFTAANDDLSGSNTWLRVTRTTTTVDRITLSPGANGKTIISAGNVGIGTTEPLEKLDVSGNATVSGNLTFSGARTIAGRSMNALTLGDSQTGNIQFYSSSNYLDSSGNLVLTGTLSAAGAKFQVDSNGDIVKLKNLTYSWPTSHTTNGVLTNDGSGGLSWSTIGSSGITPDSLDFTEFQDTLDLDANLTLNQSTYTWTQNFDGTTTTGLTYNANSLTSGTGLYISSTATGLTGDLVKIEASGNNAGVTGNVLKVGLTGASATGTALNITTAGSSGFALRVNDDGTYTDSTPFVIDASGNVGIGTTDPGTYKLYVAGNSYVSGNLTASGTIQGGTLTDGTASLTSGTLDLGTNTIYDGNLTGNWAFNSGNLSGIGNLTTTGTITAGSTLYLPDGSASSPALTFTNDTNSGLYRLDSDKIGLITGGTAAQGITIDSSGYVGIGTTEPNQKLHIAGTGSVRVLIDSNDAAGNMTLEMKQGSTNRVQIYYLNSNNTLNFLTFDSLSSDDIAFFPGGLEVIRFKEGGNVGIGTTGPDSKLHIVGGDLYVAPDSGYTFNNSSANEDLYVYGNLEVDGTTYLAALNASSLTLSGNLDMQNNLILNIGNSDTDFTPTGGLTLAGDLRLNSNQIKNSSGEVAIILNQTIGNTPDTVAKNILDYGNWLVKNDTTVGINKAALIVDQQVSNDIFTASASGTTKFTITNEGYVDIASLNAGGLVKAAATTGRLSIATAGTDYEYPLTFTNGLTRTANDVHLGGSLEESTTITQGNYDMIFNLTGSGDFRIQDNGSDVFFVKDDGNVGIGTTNPTHKLELANHTSESGGIGLGSDIALYRSAANTLTIKADYVLPAFNPGTNTIVTTETNNNSSELAMALTATDSARVAYYDSTDQDLEYYVCWNNDCTSRTVTTLASTNNVGRYPAIALDSNGYAQIAYFYYTGWDLYFIQCTNATCSARNTNVIDDNIGNYANTIDVAWTSVDGYPRIVYQDADYYYYFIQCTNASCSTFNKTAVSPTTYYGDTYGALDLDSNGYGYIVIDDNSAGSRPYYIQCTNASCSTKNTASIESDTTITVTQADIELGSDGAPRFCYYDSTNTRLKFARCTSASCASKITTVVDSGNVGQNCSLALDNNNLAYITYYDATNGDLKLARCGNQDCSQKTIITLDSSGDTGKGINKSLRLGSDGKIRVTYFDDTSDDIKYLIEGSSGQYLGSSDYYWDQVNAKYFITRGTGDVAEIYQSQDSTIESGDLVSIAPNSTDQQPLITKTTPQNASSLLGVVSTNPGLLLGGHKQFRENSFAIALVGQVPVKVSLENGEIFPGDPITFSSTPGVGAKATKAGFIIGRALEGLSGSEIGKILVSLGLSWYDPDVFLTDTGGLEIRNADGIYNGLLSDQPLESQISNIKSQVFNLKLNSGEVISRIGTFAETISAKIKTGLIETTDFISQNLVAIQANIGSLKTNLLTSNRIISPLIETESINTNTLVVKDSFVSPLAETEQIKTASLFADLIKTENLENQTATISSLFAEEIRAKKISADQIEGATIGAEYITNIINNINNITNIYEATPSISLDEIDKILAQIEKQGLDLGPYIDIATLSAQLAFVQNDFKVLGHTSLANTSIAGVLTQDATLVLSEGKQIDVLGDDLYLQKMGLGGVNIADGKVVISKEGNISILGDLAVKGKFAIKNAEDLEVASIDASGSATAKEFRIIRSVQAELGIDEIIASSSAGKGTIKAGFTSLTIKTPYAKENSLIYITPTSPVETVVPYLARILDGIGFTVEIAKKQLEDINFNWLIIN